MAIESMRETSSRLAGMPQPEFDALWRRIEQLYDKFGEVTGEMTTGELRELLSLSTVSDTYRAIADEALRRLEANETGTASSPPQG
jgi:hypothetical protein